MTGIAIRILGIDPGLRLTGWGLIEACGSRLSFLACGSIETEPKDMLAGRLADRRQGGECARRGRDDIADAADVDNEAVLLQAVDEAAQLADHAAPRLVEARCWAWQIATASASAASGVKAFAAGRSRFTIIAT